MKVSIITVVYNDQKNIINCIKSVENQDYLNIEHIIIDGKSTDSTLKIIKENLSSKIKILSEKDNGMYNALNKGIELSSGDIIGVLHSDDIFYSNKTISSIVENFNEKTDLIYGKGMYFNDFNGSAKRIYPSNNFKKYYLYFGWIPLHTTIFIRKSKLIKYGYYEEHFRIASDYDISLKWFLNKDLNKKYISKWFVKMKLGGLSTNIKNQKLKSNEDLTIINKYNLFGYFTLFFKIFRKIPHYILPKLIKYK